MPVTVTDTPGRRRGVSDPLLRPVAVNCFMRNAADFATVQAQIGEVMRAELRQLIDRAAIGAIIHDTLHGSINSRAQVFAKNGGGRASGVKRRRHFRVLADLIVFRFGGVRFAIC